MKSPLQTISAEQLSAIVAAAIAEGRHSSVPHLFCDQGQHFVASIYHVSIDRKRFCPDCADAVGCGPKSYEARMRGEMQ